MQDETDGIRSPWGFSSSELPGWVSGSLRGSQIHPNSCPLPQVRIWEIPEGGLKRNMTEAVLELYGHSRRVGLVEWHPTTNNILFSAGYDYKVSPAQPCSVSLAAARGCPCKGSPCSLSQGTILA